MKTKGLLKNLLGVGLAVALPFMPMKKANADAYLNAEFCNLADSAECDFQSSGSYTIPGSAHLLQYTDTDYAGNNFGRSFTLYGIFNVDENNLTMGPNWQLSSVTTNSDNSENFYFDITNGSGIITPPGKSFGLAWDGTEPAGIESMALDSYLMADIGDGNSKTFRGWIPAPDAITSDLAQFQPPIVPEPVSSALMLTGGAMLGYRGLRKKRANRGKK